MTGLSLPVGAAVFGIAIAAFAIVAVWRYRTRIRDFRQFADALVAGEAPSEITVSRGDLGRSQLRVLALTSALRSQLGQARQERQRLDVVIASMLEAVVVIDTEGTILLANRRAEKLFDWPAHTPVEGRPLIQLARDPELQSLVRRALTMGDSRQALVQEIVADASKDRVLLVSATPMEQGARGGAGFVLVFRDISETKRLERARRDFVANVSHELRTPLAAIRGYSETLLAGALRDPERAARFLSIIERHAERLGRLVDDLLTLSDLELGRKELTYEPTPPEQVIETACELLREKAVEKGVTLSSSLDEGTPALYVDADQVVQVLVNLIENAVKYTPAAGRVSVTATRAVLPGTLPDRPAKETWVQITVADTGIGIPADQLPRLTERFYRVDKARSRELGGTGLGLAIVKHIVQAHGGWLRIDSELNKGTTIQVVLPGVSPGKA